ncbi:hypothetical protein JW930_05605 [Candidatus Woesearchaeota archaeon]|nr:hypothetical protein [Candidatus Woesearchaeota archaeon]
MADCENLATCAFFKEYETDEAKKQALQGFVDMYCKGDKQNECVRKKVSKALGGPQNVPVNMKPDGKPILGTSDSNWPAEVKAIANS